MRAFAVLLAVLLVFLVGLCKSQESGVPPNASDTIEDEDAQEVLNDEPTVWTGVDPSLGMFNQTSETDLKPELVIQPKSKSVAVTERPKNAKPSNIQTYKDMEYETGEDSLDKDYALDEEAFYADSSELKIHNAAENITITNKLVTSAPKENDDSIPSKYLDLPTDNDKDVDKYMNPDKYADRLNFHHVADSVNNMWSVTYDETQLPCVMLRGDIQLIVPVNPSMFNRDLVQIDVPHEAEASGTCYSLDGSFQKITLKWTVSVGDEKYENQVSFGFQTNWTSEYSDLSIPEDRYALNEIQVVYYNAEIGDGDKGLMSYSAEDLAIFMTPLNESMSCFKDSQVIVGGMQVTMNNLQMEAFRPNLETLTVGEFSQSVLCDHDEIYLFDAVMTYIIWFWVGALLIVLGVFGILLALGYRRRQGRNDEDGFGYKILRA